jgi:hypothetical protein
VLWVEADDVAQITDGWLNAPIVPRVGPELPYTPYVQFTVNGIGGHKAFVFNTSVSASAWLDAHNMNLGPDVTVVAVVDAGAQPAQYADLMDFNHANGGGWVVQQDGYGPGNYFAWRKNGAFTLSPDVAYPVGPCIVEGWKQQGHVRLTMGFSTQEVDGAAGLDMTVGQLRIGNFVASGDRPFNGKISMIAAWPRALDAGELSQVRDYLRAKWGLS